MKKNYIAGITLFLTALLYSSPVFAQDHTREYWLTIREQKINITGKVVKAITVNNSIPAPTLYFTEGDTAVIHVKNLLNTNSSIHWHGLLIPSKYDGVPYLNTPPIKPGQTYTVRFKIRQNGTYWYHSHSMFQEQRGLYGAIVIHPKKKKRLYDYDKEIVLLLSDWTNENPHHIMNNLKRGTEWYAIKKGNAQSLNRVIAHHGLDERISMAWNRMPPMDISDVYYNTFLVNGKKELRFPDVHPGERIRIRVIDGSSSTFFHVQYADGKMKMISADGQNVQPVDVNLVLMGTAETYDFIITAPDSGAHEFRATAQDGSGYASVWFGTGKRHPAPSLPNPDLFHLMENQMKGLEAIQINDIDIDQKGSALESAWLDIADANITGSMSMNMTDMDMGKMKMIDDSSDMEYMHPNMQRIQIDSTPMDSMNHSKMHHMNMAPDTSTSHHTMMNDMDDMSGMKHMNMNHNTDNKPVIFNYDMLKALNPTAYDTTNHNIRHLTFNLTGSMQRYIWSINGKTLSEKDSIKIYKGEILYITLNNKTMMYHPMHLHGHFFRVLNTNGNFSPLKHTVIVPPMRSVTIEFLASEPGDWFFHCHLLYHMMAGMARTFQYADYEKPSYMNMKMLKKMDKHWYFWGNAAATSNRGKVYLSYSNRKNWIKIEGNYGWKGSKNEFEATYERFVTNYLRPYIGVITSNKEEYMDYYVDHNRNLPVQDVRGVVGIRYLLPFFLTANLRIDIRGHVRFGLNGETWLFPRLWLTYSANTDWEYEATLEYMLNQYISLSGGYNSDYSWGGGILVRF